MPHLHETHPRWRPHGAHVVAGIAALVLTAIAWRAPAATFTVNNNADTTDGVCGPAAGGCTLREAIEAVVSTPGRDTITFDPSVFPKAPGTPGISVNSALPVIVDPAGTVIDGGSGRVQVFAAGGLMSDGLVFESGTPGVPLVKVTVANVFVGGFTGTAVHLCGGVRPVCDADVSGALVRRVVVSEAGDGDGIRIEGRVVTKARVIDSVTWPSGGAGIRLFGSQSIVGARIQGSTARESDGVGIGLIGSVAVVGASIVDSIAVDGGSEGIVVRGDSVTKTKITNVVANGNGDGVVVRAINGSNTGTTISDAVTFGHPGNGIEIVGSPITAATVKHAAADGDDTTGILLDGPLAGAKLTGVRAFANVARGVLQVGGGKGLKLTDAMLVANADGARVTGDASTLQRVRAHANADSGINLSNTAENDVVTMSATAANDGQGISLETGASHNVVRKNVALGNGVLDLRDENAACDANTWTANVFRTGSEPCVR